MPHGGKTGSRVSESIRFLAAATSFNFNCFLGQTDRCLELEGQGSFREKALQENSATIKMIKTKRLIWMTAQNNK